MSNTLPPRAAADLGWASHAKEVHDILADVAFPGYTFEVGGTDRTWSRAHFDGACSVTGEVKRQSTRRWYVSEEACKNEVVQTALKCVLTSVEHEAREGFKYRDKAIYGPHFDVDALHRICVDRQLDHRGRRAAGSAPTSLPVVEVDIDAVHRRFARPSRSDTTYGGDYGVLKVVANWALAGHISEMGVTCEAGRAIRAAVRAAQSQRAALTDACIKHAYETFHWPEVSDHASAFAAGARFAERIHRVGGASNNEGGTA